MANVSPLSELVTAQVAGGPASVLFTSFDAAAQAKVSVAAQTAALSSLTGAFKSKLTLMGLDPMNGTMTAGSPPRQQIDTLDTTLSNAGLTLDQRRDAGREPDRRSGNRDDPPAAVGACAGLRSGGYRVVNPLETDPAFAAQVIRVDAAPLRVTGSDRPPTRSPTPAPARSRWRARPRWCRLRASWRCEATPRRRT